MLIYIIGPITGKPSDNIEAFELAKVVTRKRFPEAHILTPHDLYTPDRLTRLCPAICWIEAMNACIPYAENADLLVALPGWKESRGARIEMDHRHCPYMEYGDLVASVHDIT